MTNRVRIFPAAERDIDDYCDYIAKHSPEVAVRFLEALESTLDQLAEMPGLGTVRRLRNPRLQGIRWFPVSGFRNCLVFYRQKRGHIEVIRLLHAARDIDRLLGDEG